MHLKPLLVKRRRSAPGRAPSEEAVQVRDAIRLKHSSYRTEQAYVAWSKRTIYFHDVRHLSEVAALEVEAFLTHLAVKEHLAASTQNQALSALLFLYREVLHQELGPVDALRAKRPKRLPTVLTKDETNEAIFRFHCRLRFGALFPQGKRVHQISPGGAHHHLVYHLRE